MAHDDIRARLAACPLGEFKTISQAIDYACHYRRDVDALLRANEALAKALREVRDHLYTPQDYARVREIARAALAGAETGAEK